MISKRLCKVTSVLCSLIVVLVKSLAMTCKSKASFDVVDVVRKPSTRRFVKKIKRHAHKIERRNRLADLNIDFTVEVFSKITLIEL